MTEAGGSMQNDSSAPSQAGNGNAAQLDELEHEVDQLSNRAAAVNSSLDRLQQEQGASGYGLRGDMVERQASMKANLFKAEEAMQHRDAARTKKYADMVKQTWKFWSASWDTRNNWPRIFTDFTDMDF